MYKQMLANILMLPISIISLAATTDETERLVWVNEAIVATYSYDYKNYLQQQRHIADYFTTKGWISYSNALLASHLPETVAKNNYVVSAVATLPPKIITLDNKQWQATMSLLVVYKNFQYQQKQNLLVTINFGQAEQGFGIRGLAINRLQAVVTTPACVCQTTTNDKSPLKDVEVVKKLKGQ
jgi:hypothetical protein